LKLVEIFDKVVDDWTRSGCRCFRLPSVDEVLTEIAGAVGDADQEPKKKVAPSSSAMVVKLNDALEFTKGSLLNTTTWRASCRYFSAKPT
jgi:hypothetical protein